MITLAHQIGMTVVAEGVEQPHQQTEIARLGCDMAQGHLYAHPMPADAVTDFLQTQPR